MSKLNLSIENAIDDLGHDISDRRGLKHEWNSIDASVHEEIREAWREIFKKHFGNNGKLVTKSHKKLLEENRVLRNEVRDQKSLNRWYANEISKFVEKMK